MKKLIFIIIIVVSNFIYGDSSIPFSSVKSDDYYTMEFVDFYFSELKDLINDNKFESLNDFYHISRNTMNNMKNLGDKILKNKEKVENIRYELISTDYKNKEYVVTVCVEYEISDYKKIKTITSKIEFGYNFWNGSDFNITFFNETNIKDYSLDYLKINKIIQSYSSNKEINMKIEELENEGIKTILNYSPYEIDYKAYSKLLNDYAYFLSETDRYQEAIPILERVILFSPNRVVAYLNLGDCYYKDFKKSKKQSDKEKVVENYKKYVSLLKKDAKIPDRVKEILEIK